MSTFEYKGEATWADWEEFMKVMNDPKRLAEERRREKAFYEAIANSPQARKWLDEYIKKHTNDKD